MSDEFNSKLSTISIFRLINDACASINTYPLTLNNLNIQQDAYKRLAGRDDNSDEFEIFATLEQSRKQKDSDLRFKLEFSADIFILHIEGMQSMSLYYEDLGKTNATVAQQLIKAFTMLANGQLTVLQSLRNDALCAVELIFFERPGGQPKVFTMDGSYSRFIGKTDMGNYDTVVLRGESDIKFVALPRTFFLRATLGDGSPAPLQRTFTGNVLTPLTRDEYKSNINKLGNHLAGVESDDDFNNQILRSPITWILFAVLVTPVLLFVEDPWFLFAAPLAGFVALFVGSFVTAKVLMHLEQLRRTRPASRWLRLNLAPSGHTWARVLFVVSSSISLTTLNLPIYVDPVTRKLITLPQLADQTSIAVLLIPLVGFVIAAFGGGSKSRIFTAVAAFSGFVGAASIFASNYWLTHSGDAVSTPEPATSIAITAYLSVIVLGVVLFVNAFNKAADSASVDVDGSMDNVAKT